MDFIRENASRPESRLTTLTTVSVGHCQNWSQNVVRICTFFDPVCTLQSATPQHTAASHMKRSAATRQSEELNLR